jgi:hypothetical protein
MRFTATLELHGKTATGITVPDRVVEGLGGSKRPAVRVTIGSYTYRTTIAKMGGVYLIPVAKENRDAAGVAAGQEVEVHVALDEAPREVVVPDDVAQALAAEAGLREAFDALAFSHRKEHVRSVEEAKTEATRERRIVKVVEAARVKRTALEEKARG